MNYLAHLYLSFGHEEIMVGNFIADKIKGNNLNEFSDGIQKGIILHRMIDHYTDNHPVTRKSRDRIRNQYHKFSGIVIDLYYDHFLSVNWDNYSNVSLIRFTRESYRTLFRYYFLLPPTLKRILPWMAAGNWLLSYREIDNIGLALKGISTRIKVNSGIENGGRELKLYYQEFHQDFMMFFPDLIHESRGFLEKLLQG